MRDDIDHMLDMCGASGATCRDSWVRFSSDVDGPVQPTTQDAHDLARPRNNQGEHGTRDTVAAVRRVASVLFSDR